MRQKIKKIIKKKSIMGQYKSELYDKEIKKEERKVRQKIDPFSIGELIIEFNGLESDIEGSFCEIMHGNSDELGMIIMHSMSYRQKCDIRQKHILRQLNESKKTKDAKKFKEKVIKIYGTLKNIGEFRNKVVHGFREDQDEYGYIRSTNTKYGEEGIMVEQVKILNKDLEKYISMIGDLRFELEEINEQFYEIVYRRI